jgi:hypothetical protein
MPTVAAAYTWRFRRTSRSHHSHDRSLEDTRIG